MKEWMDRVIDMIFRGVVGLVLLYVLKLACLYWDFPVLAGINPATFGLIAVLGVPGFLLVLALGLLCLF